MLATVRFQHKGMYIERESNPCCREREAITGIQRETCGMDSTREVVKGVLRNG
jgi:hypothetical protein